jgi:alpha-beta hydrolase superfamily lysophospholipase
MRKAAIWYTFFTLAVVLVLALAAVPIVASDVFREPYSALWPTIYRTLDLLRIEPFPTGGGAPPRFPNWRDPGGASIYYRNVTLTTADGLELDAWYVPAVSASSAVTETATVILAHGLEERKVTMLHLVPWLHTAGFNVMLLDFRGHGASEKQPTTVGRKEVLDLQAALDWLDAKGIGGRVGGLGMSMGAAVLVNTAVQDDRLDALVLDSMFAKWNDTDFAAGYRLPPDWLVPDVPSPEELMPDIHIPVFIIHGTADILTGVDHAYRVYKAANEPKELWINDSGHAWSSWTYPEIYRQKILDFFNATLLEPSE